MAVDRRRFLKQAGVATAASGALWVTPSVLEVTKAFATSSCVVPTIAFPWTATQTGTWQAGSGSFQGFAAGAAPSPYNTAPFDPTSGGTSLPIFLSEQDPPAGTYTLGVVEGSYTTASFNLSANSTYTFTFNVRWRDTTSHVATQRVEVQSGRLSAGPWTTGYTFTTSTAIAGVFDVTPQPTMTITTTTAGAYFLRFAFSFGGTVGTGNNQRANDIALTIPTITCK